MKSTFLYIATALLLSACNSISLKPGTMEKDSVVYTDRGGYTMRRSIKDELERRGYTVLVGTVKNTKSSADVSQEYSVVPKNARYYVKVAERSEKFRPIWCVFNGVWWWNYNVSVTDQNTGIELMTWRARGCADSSMRLLRRTMDKLETDSTK